MSKQNIYKMHYWVCNSKKNNNFIFQTEVFALGACISIFSLINSFHPNEVVTIFSTMAAVVYLAFFLFTLARKWYRQTHFELHEGKFIQQGSFIYHMITYHELSYQMLASYGIKMKPNLFEVKISDEKPEFVFPNRALRLVRIQSVDTITKTKDGYIVRGHCRRYRQYKWSDKTYRYTAIIKEKEIDYTWTLMERFESIQQLKKGK